MDTHRMISFSFVAHFIVDHSDVLRNKLVVSTSNPSFYAPFDNPSKHYFRSAKTSGNINLLHRGSVISHL
jgi:hypothetical protein